MSGMIWALILAIMGMLMPKLPAGCEQGEMSSPAIIWTI